MSTKNFKNFTKRLLKVSDTKSSFRVCVFVVDLITKVGCTVEEFFEAIKKQAETDD